MAEGKDNDTRDRDNPERTGLAASQDVRKLQQHRGRLVVALALAALVALLGVLARPSPPARAL